MIALAGKPIVQGDLEALAALAAQIGCPPSVDYEQSPPATVWDGNGTAYRWEPYKLDPEDENEVAIRRWLTELTRLRTDVLARTNILMDVTLTAPFDPWAGVVSGPWIVPFEHELLFGGSSGGNPTLAGQGFYTPQGYNYGRNADGVKLWSRGVATPFRVYTTFSPFFDFQLDTAQNATGYLADNETSGSASWSYGRSAFTTGTLQFAVWANECTEAEADAVDVAFADCTAEPTVYRYVRRKEEVAPGVWEVEMDVVANWGTCTNPTNIEDPVNGVGDGTEFQPDSGPEGGEFTVAWQAVGKGKVTWDNGPRVIFHASAYYGQAGGDYEATSAPAISEDEWLVTAEEPAFAVSRTVRKYTTYGPPWSGFSNTGPLWAERLPATPNDPAETWWEARLWPVPTMRRGGLIGETFPGQLPPSQTLAGAHAVPQVAADGLWVQDAKDGTAAVEIPMDYSTRTQAGYATSGARAAIDYVQLTRRPPYGTAPAITTEIGCWRGEGAAREFVPLVTATLPAGELRKRVGITLLPVFDNLSIGYTNAALVSVRLGNWKPIGNSTDGNGHPQPAGLTAVDGTPAGVVNDLESLCRAMGAV